MSKRLFGGRGLTRAEVVVIVVIAAVLVAMIVPVLQRAREFAYKPSCQNNMKELGIAFLIYYGDNGGTLPSSAVRGSRVWNPKSCQRFATEQGTLPLTKGARATTWPMLLYPCMPNMGFIWCPSDPERPNGRIVSYWWKAAVDRAWFNGSRKIEDFRHESTQVLFYERAGWHWGDERKGLSEGATLNMTFMDGHVASKRLKNAGNAYGKSDPLAVGEPGWFNADMTKVPLSPNLGKGRYFDPHKYGDVLP